MANNLCKYPKLQEGLKIPKLELTEEMKAYSENAKKRETYRSGMSIIAQAFMAIDREKHIVENLRAEALESIDRKYRRTVMKKSALKEIDMLRIDGGMKKDRVIHSVISYHEADKLIAEMSKTAPGDGDAYDSIEYNVFWQNGMSYSGTFSLKKADRMFIGHIQRQVRRRCEFFAGRGKPEAFTDEEYSNFVNADPKRRDAAKSILESVNLE